MAMQQCIRCGGSFEKGHAKCSWCGFPAAVRKRIRVGRLLVILSLMVGILCAPFAAAIGWSLYQQSRLAAVEPQYVPPDDPRVTSPAPAVTPAPSLAKAASATRKAPPAEPSLLVKEKPEAGVQTTEFEQDWMPDNLADPDGTVWNSLTPIHKDPALRPSDGP